MRTRMFTLLATVAAVAACTEKNIGRVVIVAHDPGHQPRDRVEYHQSGQFPAGQHVIPDEQGVHAGGHEALDGVLDAVGFLLKAGVQQLVDYMKEFARTRA